MIREFKLDDTRRPQLLIVRRDIGGHVMPGWSILSEGDNSAAFLATDIEDHEHAVAMCVGLALVGGFSFTWSERDAQLR